MSQNFQPVGDGGRRHRRSIQPDEFMDRIQKQYPESDDVREAIGLAVDDVWPVGLTPDGEAVRRTGEHADLDPSYREHQRNAVVDIIANLYVADKDVVTLSAPTGAGKSLILHAAAQVINNTFNRKSFFSTPLNALIDQIDEDLFIEPDIITLKGKNNYNCVHPEDRGTRVDRAICQRQSEFDCEYKETHHENGGCPYYGRKHAGQKHPELVTNLSYLMANSMIPDVVDSKFDPREIEEIDECQSIEDFALQFVGVTLSKFTIPLVYEDMTPPPDTEDVDALIEWLKQEAYLAVVEKLEEMEAKTLLNEEEARKRDKLKEFVRKVDNLIEDAQDHHWVAETDVEDEDDWSIEFQPIFVGRFLDDFLWNQGQKIILSSATIPKGDFIEEIGLDDRDVGHVKVPSTFPPGRRPVYTDMSVGKMTWNERDRTIPKMAQKIGEIANHHSEHKGFVHCHSYSIAKRIYDKMPHAVKACTRIQNQDDREESLEAWIKADVDETDPMNEEIGGQIFLSVAMDEGISLDDDRTRWQVIAKAAYPNMQDKRVDYRMDSSTMGGTDWTWYSGQAAVNLQQAVGRGMRSKDDWCHTYVLDTSAVTLIKRNEYLFEDWFMDAVDVDPTLDEPRYR